MKKILVIGSSNTDMVVYTNRFPRPGETLLGGQFLTFPGGKGGNQAVAAARLGGDVSFIYKTGNDIFGRQATQGFIDENINVAYSGIDPEHASGVAVITIDEAGQNTIVVAPGANHQLLPTDIEQAAAAFEHAGSLLMQLEIPLETVMHAANLAAALQVKTVLNPAPAAALPDALYPLLYAITPNETEAEMITGVAVHDEVSAAQAATILLQKGVQHVIITMGEKGAYYQSKTAAFFVAAEKVQALDTTAAGDVFNGALVVALAQNKTWEQAITDACKAATISVTRKGAQASAPYLHEMGPSPTLTDREGEKTT